MFSSYNSLTFLASSSSSSSSQDIPIYGLFQCRGDLAAPDCSHCVTQAVSQLGTICPDSTGGALQLDGCFVKYDDSQFLGVEDKTLVMKKCGPPDGFNSDVLTQRDAVLAYLETSDGVYKMFRTTSSGTLQGEHQSNNDNELHKTIAIIVGLIAGVALLIIFISVLTKLSKRTKVIEE
ncbi:hypothetical protein K1719_035868 [Acacia pycnantha]|nr:hypothetical protein K1719_035868 [Acacia pycnantha]